MPAPMTFGLHQRLRHLLCVTATAWGLSETQRQAVRYAPRSGFAISY